MRIHKLIFFHAWTIEVGFIVFSSLQVLIQGLTLKGAPSPWQPWKLSAFQIPVNAGATSNVSGMRGEGKHCFFLLLLYHLPYSLSHLLLPLVKTQLFLSWQ